MNILDKIVDKVRIKLERQKKIFPIEELQSMEFPVQKPDRFKDAISKPGIQIIAEIKKASPSAGLISKDFDPLKIAAEYEAANVAAISVLTEEDFFQGSLETLQQVREFSFLPLLRKDFIIDQYQIYQTRYYGANCILLIASILSEQELKDYIEIAEQLNLNTLVEIHDEFELEKAIAVDAEIIGINNRNLKTFEIDIKTTLKLRKKIPNNKIVISESGIKYRKQVIELEKANINAILAGEALMRAENKEKFINSLLGSV